MHPGYHSDMRVPLTMMSGGHCPLPAASVAVRSLRYAYTCQLPMPNTADERPNSAGETLKSAAELDDFAVIYKTFLSLAIPALRQRHPHFSPPSALSRIILRSWTNSPPSTLFSRPSRASRLRSQSRALPLLARPTSYLSITSTSPTPHRTRGALSLEARAFPVYPL